MTTKPRNPYPTFFRRFIKKIIPPETYARYFGRHEHGSLRIWKMLAAQLEPHTAILDIGAFHGEYAIVARLVNSQAIIYAFEPNPFSAATLRGKCEGLDIHLEECAVTQKIGRLPFLLSSATSHIGYTDDPSSQDCVQVRTIRLDDWAVEKNLYISLIKIDVEGAESDVLHGAKNILSQYQPVVLCEVLSDEAGVKVMNALPAGYRYYHIDENSGLSARPAVDRKLWRNKNWLFLHESKLHLLADLI